MLEDARHGVARLEDVRKAEHRERPAGRAPHQLDRRLEDSDARPFAPDQRARDIEAVLGEQVVEVITGDAAWNVRVAGAHEVAIAPPQRVETAVDLAAPAAL